MQLYRINKKRLLKACHVKSEECRDRYSRKIKIDDYILIEYYDSLKHAYIYFNGNKIFEVEKLQGVYYEYYCKIPKQLVKKINNWSKSIIKQNKQTKKQEKKKNKHDKKIQRCKLEKEMNSIYKD